MHNKSVFSLLFAEQWNMVTTNMFTFVYGMPFFQRFSQQKKVTLKDHKEQALRMTLLTSHIRFSTGLVLLTVGAVTIN